MKKLYSEEKIQAIADAIRDKLGDTHTFTVSEMPDAIMSISSGGGGAGGRNILFLTDQYEDIADKMPYGVETVWLLSDTVWNPDLTTADFQTDIIQEVVYINRLLVKITLDTEKVAGMSLVTVQAKSSAYLNHNGLSDPLRLKVGNRLSLFEDITLGRKTIASGYSDGGTCTILVEKYGIIDFPSLCLKISEKRPVHKSASITGDSLLNVGGNTLAINNRDNGYLNIYCYEIPMDDVKSLTRITWDGYMPYNQEAKNRASFDIYFLGNGDFYIKLRSLGTNESGQYNRNGMSFKNPGPGGYISFYRIDFAGTRFKVVYEKYDVKQHLKSADSAIIEAASDTVFGYTDELTYFLRTDVDDQTYTITNEVMAWPYAGMDRHTFYVSTNAWIGVKSGSSEDIRLNRRDAKANCLLHGVYYLTDMDLYCYKIRWYGYSQYNVTSSIDQIFEVYFFSNGDAMIWLEKRGTTQGGTYDFFGTPYSIEGGEFVSFYRKDEQSSGWEVVHEKYDIEHHIA